MTTKQSIIIPASLVPEFEAWGEMTARLFGQLRRQLGLKPADVPEDQTWFWTDAWQEKERQADNDIAAEQVDTFETVEALIQDLHAHV